MLQANETEARLAALDNVQVKIGDTARLAARITAALADPASADRSAVEGLAAQYAAQVGDIRVALRAQAARVTAAAHGKVWCGIPTSVCLFIYFFVFIFETLHNRASW
jgi:hypothetical protein